MVDVPTIIGDGKVEVWHSNPEFGDPYEGVFHMEPPYTDETLDRKSRESVTRWIDTQSKNGLTLTTKVQVRGTLIYTHPERHDLSEEHKGDDEFVCVAWFKRERPIILTSDEVAMRRELAIHHGFAPIEPSHWTQDPTVGYAAPIADEMDEYTDPSGRDAQGLIEEDHDDG